MRNVPFLILLTLLFLFSGCGNKVGTKGSLKDTARIADTEITILSPVEHDFGIYHEKVDKTCWFSYRNTGEKPLVIYSAIADCGCTVVDFSKKPLAPGKVDSLKVTYDGNGFRGGSFRKWITVTSNGSVKPVELRIRGAYYPAD